MKPILLIMALVVSTKANAVLGPIPIYLNAEYRTQNPVISSIATTIKLDREAIENSGANTFLELLATIPAIQFFDGQGNINAIFIRGNEARHTLILIDGVRVHDISSPDGAAGYALDSIPLAQIERIEIVKGGHSSMYGSGAIGGIIQIFTKKSADYNNVNISIGSNNSKKISFVSNTKNEQGFINFNVSKYQTAGISALANNFEKDGIDNQSLGLKMGYNLSENTDFSIGFLKSAVETEYDDFYGSAGVFNHNKSWHKTLENLNLGINHQFSSNINSQLSLTKINQNRDSFTGGISDGFNNKKYQTQDLTLLNELKLRGALLSVGLVKIIDKNITDNQTLSSRDIFAGWQKNVSSFDINTGARFINHSDFGSHAIYNLGVAKYLRHGIKFISSYGTAFNAPTLYQLNGDNFAGGNPDLKPETSKNAEIGLEKQHYWGVSNIRFYKSTVADLIVYRNTDTRDYFNEDKLNIKGVELSVAANIKNYDLSFSYNFTGSKLNNSNTQQSRRPKNMSDLTISKTYNKFKNRLQMINKSSTIDGTATLGGYTLVNFNSSYALSNDSKIALSINNAFDKNYAVANGYNQLGRTLNLGLNYNF